MTPRATLRLQFTRGFTLGAARARVGYFARLGISHLYASPITRARAGSQHGYDVVDPTVVNPELGGEEALRDLVSELRSAGMGLIVDIVPNHMAATPENPWWHDVLRHGRSSAYAGYFDIDWGRPGLGGRVLAPFLGKPYWTSLADRDVALTYDAGQGRFVIAVRGAARYPLSPDSERNLADATQPSPSDVAGVLARHDGGKAAGRRRLHWLLERQAYRLAWWRSAADAINWRRFFDVNELIALQAEDPAVFDATHALVLRLYSEGLIDGVRVDHVDGLADPGGYCRRLRAELERAGAARPSSLPRLPPYVIVEKILAPGERLRPDWPVDGTTGYDFMNEVAAVLHAPEATVTLDALWTRIAGHQHDFDEEARLARRHMLERSFAGERERLVGLWLAVAAGDPSTRDLSQGSLRRALCELLVNFRVYRTYSGAPIDSADSTALAAAIDATRAGLRPEDRGALDLLARRLREPAPRRIAAPVGRAILALQKLSGPLTAKAVEDTAFYRYGRLLSRNEVGSDPTQLATTAAEFDACCAARVALMPHGMLATATHDQKRGEDARMRLAVLSEVAEEWSARVDHWCSLNAALRTAMPASEAPSGADELMLYQTLVGAWPPELSPDDMAGRKRLADRVAQWQVKALREAKLASSWVEPDEAYEAACARFLDQLLLSPQGEAFVHDLHRFVERIAPAGVANALAQCLLRLAAPGVPDTYQGRETWDFSLVDPDNRSPVDWDLLAAAIEAPEAMHELMSSWRDGRIKQQVVARALAARKRWPALFAHGTYLPLHAEGPAAGHVLGFVRHASPRAIAAVVARLPFGLDAAGWPLLASVWEGTAITMPPGFDRMAWGHVLEEGRSPLAGPDVPLSSLLDRLPVALLVAEPAS
jgi:(1->4)-alpha-D-glucan 1-alpha-D-glucosylmutase